MSRTQFYGYRTPYDEEQSRERYLEYLKVAGRTSALKQGAERDAMSGVVPSKPTEKTTSEILADEAEMTRILQQRISQLVQRADSRPRSPVETDEDYEQRTNPIQYVLTRLTQPQQKLLITSFEPIRADLGGSAGNLLPTDFLVYIDAFERAFERSGGVSKFNQSTRILDELQGLRADMVRPQQIQHLRGLVQGLAENLSDEIRQSREITSREMKELDAEQRRELEIIRTQGTFLLRSANDVVGRLSRLQEITQMIDYDKIAQIVQQGTESVLQGQAEITRGLNRMEIGELGAIDKVMESQKDIQSSILRSQINAESIFKQLLDKLETLPTQAELKSLSDAFDFLFFSQQLDYQKANAVVESANQLLATISEGKLRDIEALLSNIDAKNDAILNMRKAELAVLSEEDLRKQVKREMFRLPSGNVKSRLTTEEQAQLEAEVARRMGQTYIGAEKIRASDQPSIEESFRRREPPLAEATAEPKPKSLIIEEEEEEEIGARGIKSHAFMVKNKIHPKFSKIVGRGIAVPSNQTRYSEFGNYAISQPALSRGILSLRYLTTGRPVQSVPATKITEEFTDFLDEFLETQHLDKKRLDKLPANEKRIFAKLINGSGLYGKYKVRLMKSKDEEEEEKRFNLVKGIYIAGNDNPQVVKELKHFIIKFMADGRIPKKEGTDLLLQLAL